MELHEVKAEIGKLEDKEESLFEKVSKATDKAEQEEATKELEETQKELAQLAKTKKVLEAADKRIAEKAKQTPSISDYEVKDGEIQELDKLEQNFDNDDLAKFIATNGQHKLSGALKEANEEARRELSVNNNSIEYKDSSFVIPGKMIRKEWEKGNNVEKATVSQGSSAIAPTIVGTYTDAIRQSAVYSRVIPGSNIMQGLTADVTLPAVGSHNLVWEGENDAAADIGAQFSKDTLSPVRLSGKVPISKRLLMQNGDIAMQVIMRDLGRSESNKIDAALFSTANVSGAIPAIAATSGVLTFTEAATYAAPSNTARGTMFDDIISAVQTAANNDIQVTSIVHNTKSMGDLVKSPQVLNVSGAVQGMSANGVYVVNINGIDVYLTTSTTSNGTTSADFIGGDFNYQFLGFFGGVEISVNPWVNDDKYEDRIVYHRHLDASAIRGAGFVYGQSLLS